MPPQIARLLQPTVYTNASMFWCIWLHCAKCLQHKQGKFRVD